MTQLNCRAWRDHFDRRCGFTLVELLVVIAIIGILASMLLMGLWSVAQNARQDRTLSVVKRIDVYVQARWSSYLDRRIGVRMIAPFARPRFPTEREYMRIVDPSGSNAAAIRNHRLLSYGRVVAYIRLAGIREIMRMELPDRKIDLLTPAEMGAGVPATIVPNAGEPLTNLAPPILRNRLVVTLDSVPALWLNYRAKALSQLFARYGNRNWNGWTTTHESAECLYLILSTMADDDKAALDWFKESEIGDIDNDGMPEILDAWGTPIVFVRWPSGFVKEYTPPPQHFQIAYLPYSEVMMGDRAWREDGTTVEAHVHGQATPPLGDQFSRDWQSTGGSDDPFDPLKVDVRWYDAQGATFGVSPAFAGTGTHHAWNNDPFELTPLIVSAGPDKLYDIAFASSFPPWFATQTPSIGAQSDGIIVPNDPYVGRLAGSRFVRPGSIFPQRTGVNLRDHAAGDNIHNHAVEVGAL